MNFSRACMSKILPENKERFADFDEFYKKVMATFGPYKKDDPVQELDEFFKSVYELDTDTYNDLRANAKPETAFIKKNISFINRAMKESDEKVYAINNMVAIYNVRKSVINRIISNSIDTGSLENLKNSITVKRPNESKVCQLTMKTQLLKWIKLNYVDFMLNKRKENAVEVQERIEKALSTFITDDVLLDFYLLTIDMKDIQEAFEHDLRERYNNRMLTVNKQQNSYSSGKSQAITRELKKGKYSVK